jgi:hypothetical protein
MFTLGCADRQQSVSSCRSRGDPAMSVFHPFETVSVSEPAAQNSFS